MAVHATVSRPAAKAPRPSRSWGRRAAAAMLLYVAALTAAHLLQFAPRDMMFEIVLCAAIAVVGVWSLNSRKDALRLDRSTILFSTGTFLCSLAVAIGLQMRGDPFLGPPWSSYEGTGGSLLVVVAVWILLFDVLWDTWSELDIRRADYQRTAPTLAAFVILIIVAATQTASWLAPNLEGTMLDSASHLAGFVLRAVPMGVALLAIGVMAATVLPAVRRTARRDAVNGMQVVRSIVLTTIEFLARWWALIQTALRDLLKDLWKLFRRLGRAVGAVGAAWIALAALESLAALAAGVWSGPLDAKQVVVEVAFGLALSILASIAACVGTWISDESRLPGHGAPQASHLPEHAYVFAIAWVMCASGFQMAAMLAAAFSLTFGPHAIVGAVILVGALITAWAFNRRTSNVLNI